MKNKLKNILSFLRWRIIAFRHLQRLKMLWHLGKFPAMRASTEKVNELGYFVGPSINKQIIEDIVNLVSPRLKAAQQVNSKQPFINLLQKEDLTENNPILKLAFSKEIFDEAISYYKGKLSFFSIQLLYSFASDGKYLKESQFWHKDFGDTNSFHSIIYLNDVDSDEDGPFTFIDKINTKKINKSLFIRRIDDNTFLKELKDESQIIKFFGKKGSVVFVDPSVCYHYGSRCQNPRLALFVTFNSNFPFDKSNESIYNNREKLIALCKAQRPDLSEVFIEKVFSY